MQKQKTINYYRSHPLYKTRTQKDPLLSGLIQAERHHSNCPPVSRLLPTTTTTTTPSTLNPYQTSAASP